MPSSSMPLLLLLPLVMMMMMLMLACPAGASDVVSAASLAGLYQVESLNYLLLDADKSFRATSLLNCFRDPCEEVQGRWDYNAETQELSLTPAGDLATVYKVTAVVANSTMLHLQTPGTLALSHNQDAVLQRVSLDGNLSPGHVDFLLA
ncbi:hypothetical protein RI367_002257 [Sorochytrium milnesiophthora]